MKGLRRGVGHHGNDDGRRRLARRTSGRRRTWVRRKRENREQKLNPLMHGTVEETLGTNEQPYPFLSKQASKLA